MRNLYDSYDAFAETAQIPSDLRYGDPAAVPEPAVTVIMPVYHRPERFEEALRSVVGQDFDRPFEVVVVDNHEADPSPNLEVVRRVAAPNVLYYHNRENLGMYGNWNRGIVLARAPFVTYCHDDDRLTPGALRRLMALQPLCGDACILSVFNMIDEEGRFRKTMALRRSFLLWKPRSFYRYSLLGQVLGNVTCGDGSLYRRERLLEIGGFDKSFYPAADYALNLCYARRYGAVVNNIPTSDYRIGENESLQVFRAFPEAERSIHGQMGLDERLPKCFARRLVEAHYNSAVYGAEQTWGGKDGPQGGASAQLSWRDRMLLWLVRSWDRLHKYCFCWKKDPSAPSAQSRK